jgi:SPP1 family predicted phage head-tail adaptor
MPSPRIAAGKLRHPVELARVNLTQGSSGGWSKNDAGKYASVYAEIVTLTGKDLYNAQQQVSEATHLVTIRWMPGVLAKDLVWFNDAEGNTRTFQIEAKLNPDELAHVLRLICVERNDSANTW